jgi:hypothetical protein
METRSEGHPITQRPGIAAASFQLWLAGAQGPSRRRAEIERVPEQLERLRISDGTTGNRRGIARRGQSPLTRRRVDRNGPQHEVRRTGKESAPIAC